MRAVGQPKRRWDTSRYMRIVDARHDAGRLTVAFEDHTRASVDVAQLAPRSSRSLDWNALRVNRYEIVVPTYDGDEVEISWLAIRLLTDAEFSAHWEAAFLEEARDVGRRVQHLRERQGVSLAELAARSGIAAEKLARIEEGEAGVDLPALVAILSSLGRSFNDLVDAPTEQPVASQRP